MKPDETARTDRKTGGSDNFRGWGLMSYDICVISDTHDLLREAVTSALTGCKAILHAGDIGSRPVLTMLQRIAPVYAVQGNADEGWGTDLPRSLDASVYGIHFFMTHKKKDLPSSVEDYDLIICGHSHRYEEHSDGRCVFLNPGSCGPRRFVQPVTMAGITIDEVGFHIERIDLPHSLKEASAAEKNGMDMKALASRIMKETDRGRSIKEIADKTGADDSLVEQIVRLYLTHPGVTEDGILNKMGL